MNNKVRDFRAILRIFERELNLQNNSACCSGVSIPQCHSLMELAKKSPITLNELSSKLSLDKSTVSRTVESLVKLNYVKREIPSENRRITKLSLTETGKEVSTEINSGNDNYYQRVFEVLSENELTQFLNLFEKIVVKMHDINNATGSC